MMERKEGKMSEIKSRRVSSVAFSWECPHCGYNTHEYGTPQMPEYYKEKHEPTCRRARELGLEPVFRNGYLFGHNQKIIGWKRVRDGAEMELHSSYERYKYVPCENEEEALAEGYTQDEWLDESINCSKKVTWRVMEVRFVVDGRWQTPIEVYDVPLDWDWGKPDAEIPWRIR
jgi:hypothetical protein